MSAIHAAIHAIQKNVPTLAKNGVGPATQGGYKFLAVDDVLGAVKPLLDEHGVIVFPSLVNADFEVIEALRKDNERVPRINTFARLTYDFTFVAVEDGSTLVTRVIGEGADTQDKAVRKATTSAWKIALIQTFALITGEVDPDAQDGGRENNDAAPTAESKGQRTVNAAKASPARPNNTALENAKQGVRDAWKQIHGDDVDYQDNGYMALGNKTFTGRWASSVDNLNDLTKRILNGEVA
jgi:hypothetical protein